MREGGKVGCWAIFHARITPHGVRFPLQLVGQIEATLIAVAVIQQRYRCCRRQILADFGLCCVANFGRRHFVFPMLGLLGLASAGWLLAIRFPPHCHDRLGEGGGGSNGHSSRATD